MDDPSDLSTLPFSPPPPALTPGQILGTRYRIISLLGRGGMGEVWLAYDLKLQIDVALKSILAERFPGEHGLELLRREVRAARDVLSPNVCRIFDLVDQGGLELVSMEYIDGQTLLDVLHERSPLELQEATRIASQFLSGLEAIHQAGFIHRDVKPENIMLTRTGRVVLMDFGLAKGIAEGHHGTVAGTPAYMAPEQMRGEALDARADLFAAGMILAEMIAPEGVKERVRRESVWALVRHEPPRLFDSPWRAVLERAVAGDRERRYASARDLARALEEVTLQVEGAEDKRPYPGLESFTEADAEFFFGREIEVEAVWKKLQRANLLAIIGPSGAGKTSFVQAGLIPARPTDWRHVTLRPGSSPFVALTRALAPELAADKEALDRLLQIEDAEQVLAGVGAWRGKHSQVLIVVDQFEELFTLCRPEVQTAFADLLGRLATEADVHVLLVMRDDFLFHCHQQSRLAPVAADLTILAPPAGNALRRALVQPALLCGYRFEDESMADEMLGAIEGERGALPLLAFAAARLWKHRDRERGLLTREGYARVGGVSGALAQHAEATLEHIGSARQPLVREIFRNLVTAQGTRASAEVDELLSAFPDQDEARSVLHQLVDARLLTSFEVPGAREGEAERHHVEIVHESLLTRWPRLVRWQTQDADGAQLRDQLRQAAQLWKERHESNDLLWTGTAYDEFALWRERYPGSLTATEEAFARAMVLRAERQRRRRRAALSAAFTFLIGIVLVIGWYARAEKLARLDAQAAGLITVGRAELEENPSVALAYAIASLERADTPSNRYFALEALSRGPAAWILPLGNFGLGDMSFSPDGSHLALGGWSGAQILSRDGSPAVVVDSTTTYDIKNLAFHPDGDRVVFRSGNELRVWSLSEGAVVRRLATTGIPLPSVNGGRMTFLNQLISKGEVTGVDFFAWAGDASEPELLGPWDWKAQGWFGSFGGRMGNWASILRDRRIYACPFNVLFPGGDDAHPAWGHEQLVGEHPNPVLKVTIDPTGAWIASADRSGEIRVWSRMGDSWDLVRRFQVQPPVIKLDFNPSCTMLAALCTPEKRVHLWDLLGPRDAGPRVLRYKGNRYGSTFAFDPSGQWLVVGYMDEIAIWPVERPGSYALKGMIPGDARVFTPDGQALIGTTTSRRTLRIWNLQGRPTRDLFTAPGPLIASLDYPGQRAVVYTEMAYHSTTQIISISDGSARKLVEGGSNLVPWEWSPNGRLLAGAAMEGGRCEYRVWDVDTGAFRALHQEPPDVFNVSRVRFATDGSIFVSGDGGVVKRWNPADGAVTIVARGLHPQVVDFSISRDGRFLLAAFNPKGLPIPTTRSELKLFDLSRNTAQTITTYGNNVMHCRLDSTGGSMAVLDYSGAIRVGRVGDEPHVVICPPGLNAFAMSPDWRWMALATNPANTSADTTVTIWPVPEGRPIQSLSHQEFLEYLRARTNLRVVADKATLSGYRVDKVPFNGWGKIRAGRAQGQS